MQLNIPATTTIRDTWELKTKMIKIARERQNCYVFALMYLLVHNTTAKSHNKIQISTAKKKVFFFFQPDSGIKKLLSDATEGWK